MKNIIYTHFELNEREIHKMISVKKIKNNRPLSSICFSHNKSK